MSKRRLKLILTLTASVLILGYWGFQEPEYLPPALTEEQQQQQIDAFIVGAVSVEYDQQGAPYRELTSPRMSHYPNADRTLLEQPDMLIYRDQKPPLRVLADEGEIGPNNQEVLLRENVSMTEQLPRGFSLQTPFLRIEPDNDYAETDAPVTLRHKSGVMHSIGMKAYLAEDRIQLLNNVRGLHEPQ